MLMYFFWQVFSKPHPVYDQTQGSRAVFFFTFTDNSIVYFGGFEHVLGSGAGESLHSW
jgi:hypothetical protein